MARTPGTHLGPYEIAAQTGVGEMALKVLRQAFTDDPEV